MRSFIIIVTFLCSLYGISSAKTNEIPFKTGIYTIELGDIQIKVVTDGHLLVNPVQAEFAQHIDSIKVANLLKKNFAASDEVDLAMNILLLKTPDRLILIDSGAGDEFGSQCGRLYGNLKYVGINPDSITDIVLTHAHPDHIGGLTDREGHIRYPNADIHISKEEYDFWMSESPDFSKSTMTDKEHIKMLVDVAKRNLQHSAPKIHSFMAGETLLECLQTIPAPGHTPGHIALRIFSGDDELYHIADVVHSEIISFEHPEWIYNSDTDHSLGIETRKRMLKQLAGSKALFFAYHLPWPGLGHVKYEGNHYKWIPQRITTPY